MRDPMDQWLESQGLYRKLIAKDGSCLFRAVSEQVFHTQVLHTKVRMACVNFMKKHVDLFRECGEESLNERILSMQNPWEWGGKLEMKVMSFMYRRDFLVYQELSMPPVKATCNGFKEKIVLCQLGNNQYDSVYPKEYVDSAGFCQCE
ncbi:OTU domain-containing protein 4-like [Hetaerina americana]|uniref:OTU domain-containing protein 4-like n=1 Tax=Hetaerina americana TaxID=62018 RepID=UPI003A7F5767